MAKYIFLAQNGELYYIGITENLERITKALKPAIIIEVLKSKDSEIILGTLHRNYSDSRLPESNYFRLSKSQAIECKERLKKGRGKDDFKPFFSGFKLVITILLSWLFLSFLIIKFGFEPIFNRLS